MYFSSLRMIRLSRKIFYASFAMFRTLVDWSVGRSLVRRLFLYRKAISEKPFPEKYFQCDGSYRYAILSTLSQLIYIESRIVLPILSFVWCARLRLPHHSSSNFLTYLFHKNSPLPSSRLFLDRNCSESGRTPSCHGW